MARLPSDDTLRADTFSLPLSLLTRAHKLQWYGETCLALSEVCGHARAKRVLRELAVDLLIEAKKQRSLVRRREAEALQSRLAPPLDITN
jgi:hypothetical protein